MLKHLMASKKMTTQNINHKQYLYNMSHQHRMHLMVSRAELQVFTALAQEGLTTGMTISEERHLVRLIK